MKLIMTRESRTVDLELNSAPVTSSKILGSINLGFDQTGMLARITVADPAWQELPKVEFEGFSFKTVSFQVKGN